MQQIDGSSAFGLGKATAAASSAPTSNCPLQSRPTATPPPPPPIPCAYFHWASVVSELTRDVFELHGLSLRVVDRQTSAWVCIDVRTVISTNGVVYNLPNAHISLASVEFRAVPDSRTMRAASLTRTHFFQNVNDIELMFPIWRGRLKTP